MKQVIILLGILFLLCISSSYLYPQYNSPWYNNPPFGIPSFPSGTVNHETYHSTLHNVDIGYMIYRPEEYYTNPVRKFPLIFYCHGSGGNEVNDPSKMNYFYNAIMDGRLPKCIVVFVNASMSGNYVFIENSIITELLPYLENTSRVTQDRNYRALIGFSMGGFGSFYLGIKHPDLFKVAISLGGAMNINGNALYDALHQNYVEARKLCMVMYYGLQDYWGTSTNPDFSNELNLYNVPHFIHSYNGIDHNSTQYFDELQNEFFAFIKTNFRGPNKPPIISVSYPKENSLVPPGDLNVKVNITDLDGKIIEVKYYLNGKYTGIKFNQPFGITLSDLAPGEYELKISAYDGYDYAITNIHFTVADNETLKTPILATPNIFDSKKQNTKINFIALNAEGTANIKIVNVYGKTVKEFHNLSFSSGSTLVEWDGKDNNGKEVSPGIYFAIIEGSANTILKIFVK